MPSRLKKQNESKYQNEKIEKWTIQYLKLFTCPQSTMKTKSKKYEWSFVMWRVENSEIFL
jgi:hypothetical protein